MAIFLGGCVPQSQTSASKLKSGKLTQKDLSAAESILVHSRDYQGLAEFYKGNLKKKDTLEMRLKLAKNYLVMHDADSAVFYLQPLAEKEPMIQNSELYFILAKAYYESESSNAKAIYYANRAVKIDSKNGDALNLLGIIYSSEMNVKKSREYFNQARQVYFDDIKIKNNLAMLNIIEGKYNKALVQLASLYKLQPDDKVIKTNLLLVLAKKKDYESFYTLLSYNLKKREIYQLYLTFSGMQIKELGKLSTISKTQVIQ